MMDRIGTRRGLTFTVAGYSIVSMLTSLASGFLQFRRISFSAGRGESANWPAATKAVSEWFPNRERALATAIFDSGSSIGGAIAPFIVLWIYFRWGWRPAFMIPGLLGFVWLIAWRWLYYPPESHPRISDAELRLITADKLENATSLAGQDENLVARPAQASSDVGDDCRQKLHRSGLVLCYRLVPDFPGGKRNRTQDRLDCGVGSVHRRRPGKFFRRRCVGLPGQAGMVAGSGEKSRSSFLAVSA